MLIEDGEFTGCLQRRRWSDCIPLDAAAERSPDDDWSSPLESVHRYRVSEQTPIVRVESFDAPLPDPPPGYRYCWGPPSMPSRPVSNVLLPQR